MYFNILNMQNNSDPSYLRTIYDGLNSGSLNKDNASALPIGLVGIYEDAIPPESSINERKRFLDFFTVWASLKKEVSLEFILPLLEGWTEEHLLDFIAIYSKWFNSPVSGKYQIYHERLCAFILQKISHKQFTALNDLIINHCQNALLLKNVSEWERYALEYISSHLLISAIENRDDSALKSLSYNTTHWNRQIKISKGFDWSKRMLNDMMLWASKYNEDEVIECALNKVDLHHQEQNDAPRIVELVANNDIDIALQRIESFGGNDKEGLQRKFILYMLCLMELTLLESKDKPFSKAVIEKLLKHLDDNLPVDHSLLNWNDFFPSYLIFQMVCEWSFLGLDYLILYKRTNKWDNDWLLEKFTAIDSVSDVLLNCIEMMSDEGIKHNSLKTISIELAKQGKVEMSLKILHDIIDDEKTTNTLRVISSELFKRFMYVDAKKVMTIALENARRIKDEFDRSIALKDISNELAIQGRQIDALLVIQEALVSASKINGEIDRSGAFMEISIELICQGEIEKALEYTVNMSEIFDKCLFLISLSTELTKQGMTDMALSKMQESLAFANRINVDWKRFYALKVISLELIKQGLIKKAIEIARGISLDSKKFEVFKIIINELIEQGKVNESIFIIQEAIEIARNMTDEKLKSSSLRSISLIFTNQNKIEDAELFMDESLKSARLINDLQFKSNALREIALSYARQRRWCIAETISLEIPIISERYSFIVELSEIAFEFYSLQIEHISEVIILDSEFRKHYLRSFSSFININKFNKNMFLKVRNYFFEDIFSMKVLLTKYSLNILFFDNFSVKDINRFNQSLDIQWAIDIKNSINVN